MKHIFFVLLLVTALIPSYSQMRVITDTIYSDALKEKRVVKIALPDSYNNEKFTPANYPVFYILDAELAFDYMATVVKYLSRGVYAHIPEMIVVGIVNTNRTRDFTPTKSKIISPDNNRDTLFTQSGGLVSFADFVASLQNHIHARYRTSGYNIIAGHSFGGLAVANMLLKRPNLFNAYIINDASFWWDNEYSKKTAGKLLPGTNYNHIKIYLSQADNRQKGSFPNHYQAIKNFVQLLATSHNKTFDYKYSFYPQEDHGTIALPATYDALKYIFSAFNTDFKNMADNPAYLETHYQELSENLHFTFHPAEPMLRFALDYFIKQNLNKAAANTLQLYHKLYPKTAPAHL